jgi:putative tricarboxylic transport membrane protein
VLVGAALLREALAGHVAHEGGFDLDWRAVAWVSAGLVLEIVVLETAGWIFAAAVMFVLVARAFGSRRLLLDLTLGLALTVGSFAVFTYGLGLDLPAGPLEGLLSPAEEAAE